MDGAWSGQIEVRQSSYTGGSLRSLHIRTYGVFSRQRLTLPLKNDASDIDREEYTILSLIPLHPNSVR
jgi:hypothetical protein